jgi:hypothetical protein
MNNIVKRINKTKKNTLKKCEHFCKNDYMVKMDKVYKKSAKKWKVVYSPTKKDKQYSYRVCKKTFCNPKCEGYDFYGNVKQQEKFKKQIQHGFQQSYTSKEQQELQRKGALSGCVDVLDYPILN